MGRAGFPAFRSSSDEKRPPHESNVLGGGGGGASQPPSSATAAAPASSAGAGSVALLAVPMPLPACVDLQRPLCQSSNLLARGRWAQARRINC